MKWYRMLYSMTVFCSVGFLSAEALRWLHLYSGEKAEEISHLVSDPIEKGVELISSACIGFLILGIISAIKDDNKKVKSIFKEELDSLVRVTLSSSTGFSVFGLFLFVMNNDASIIEIKNIDKTIYMAFYIFIFSIILNCVYTYFFIKDDVFQCSLENDQNKSIKNIKNTHSKDNNGGRNESMSDKSPKCSGFS